jgi:hypothetical protein
MVMVVVVVVGVVLGGGGMVAGGMIVGGMVVIRGVFVYFEILARCPRVRVRSAEVCFYYAFTINSTTNRLINMHSIEVY